MKEGDVDCQKFIFLKKYLRDILKLPNFHLKTNCFGYIS